jgi:hypothetical protein
LELGVAGRCWRAPDPASPPPARRRDAIGDDRGDEDAGHLPVQPFDEQGAGQGERDVPAQVGERAHRPSFRIEVDRAESRPGQP